MKRRRIWGGFSCLLSALVALGTAWPSADYVFGQAEAAPAETPAVTEQPQLPPEIQKQVEEAVALFNKSDVPGALAVLKAIYAAAPQTNPPRLIMATWFAQLKNQKAVLASLEMATEETPDDPEAWLLLGEIAYSQGSLTAAELLFQRAESLITNYSANAERQKALRVKLLNDKVNLSQTRGRWDQMQVALGSLIKEQGESAELSRRVALSFFQKNEDDSARKWLLHADKQSGGKGLPADAVMARFYLGRSDLEKAKASLDAALAAHPDSPEVLSLSLMMALNENDLARAASSADKLLAQSPESVDVLKNCGSVALFQGDFAKAEQLFQQAVNKAPADMDAVNGLALAMCEQNDAEKQKTATQYAATNVQKQSNNRDFLGTLGWTLYRAGNKEAAKEVLQQSMAGGQINAAVAYYLAVLLNDEGQTDQAKQLLTAAVGTKPPFFKRAAATELLNSLGK
ncbi:MAG: tetratricopeptide repeat protein [Planctomycetia bacterium]|nr:tetratricopeptide repeat protein [Planctomycetia bacterium]